MTWRDLQNQAAELLEKERERRKFTASAWADLLGVSRNAYLDFRNLKRMCEMKLIARMFEAAGLELVLMVREERMAAE